jgi:hypothetical protein
MPVHRRVYQAKTNIFLQFKIRIKIKIQFIPLLKFLLAVENMQRHSGKTLLNNGIRFRL